MRSIGSGGPGPSGLAKPLYGLEAEGYPWIGCECCKGTVWVPFKMIRETIPALSSWTLDELAAKMKCDKCGKERLDRYYPARQSDAPGFCEELLRVRADTLKAKRHGPACGKSGGTEAWQVEAKRRAPRSSPSLPP